MTDRINERNKEIMSSIFDKVQPAVKKETRRVAMITAVGLAVQKAASATDEGTARMKLKASYSQRFLMMMLWVIAAIVAPCFHFVAGIAPLLFPGTGIKIVGIFHNKN